MLIPAGIHCRLYYSGTNQRK